MILTLIVIAIGMVGIFVYALLNETAEDLGSRNLLRVASILLFVTILTVVLIVVWGSGVSLFR